MKPKSQTERREVYRVGERAAEWLCSLEEADVHDLVAFSDWLRASPLHVREFLMMSSLSLELQRMDSERRHDVQRILNDVAGNIVPLRADPITTNAPRRGSTAHWLTLAALVLLTVATAAFVPLGLGESYETEAGEQRTLVLEDGSSVRLNVSSRIEVEMDGLARNVALVEGEAVFKVAHDADRPFRVRAAGTVIQAMGTEFNVNLRPSGTTVSVLEGKVAISGGQLAHLLAGQEIKIDARGRLERRGAVDPDSMAPWRSGFLTFKNETLQDIVAEFNRYNANLRMGVAGEDVGSRRYTAVFRADDPEALVQLLRAEGALDVEQTASRTTIRARRPALDPI